MIRQMFLDYAAPVRGINAADTPADMDIGAAEINQSPAAG